MGIYRIRLWKIQLTKYTGDDTTLTVPSKVNGKDVYSIGSNKAILEYDEDGLTELTNTTNIIGELNADFSLEEYIIDSSTAPFTSIIFTKGIEKIGNSAFFAINNVISIELSSAINSFDHFAFYETDLKYLEIPDGIEKINKSAFSGCTKLQSIRFSSNIKIIEEKAFKNNTYIIKEQKKSF